LIEELKYPFPSTGAGRGDLYLTGRLVGRDHHACGRGLGVDEPERGGCDVGVEMAPGSHSGKNALRRL